jgi:ubiquitin-conjugating enzyme E2 variant
MLSRAPRRAPLDPLTPVCRRRRLLQTAYENRIYTLSMACGTSYPREPPTVRFVTKVNLACVSKTNGCVDPTRCAVLKNWSRNYGIETILLELRKEMASGQNRRLPQPAEGARF